MGYISKMYAYEVVTEDKKKIKVFNEVAEFIECGMKKEDEIKLSEGAQELLKKLRNSSVADELRLDMPYFFYRLSEDGYILCGEDDDPEDPYREECEAKHYASELLAVLLSFVADNTVTLQFVGEDGEAWGYRIVPSRKGEPIVCIQMPMFFDEKGHLHLITDGNKEEVYQLIS